MRERLPLTCSGLGIEESLGAKLSFVELAIRPVAKVLAEMEVLDDQADRIHGLKETIRKQANFLGLHGEPDLQVPTQNILENIVSALLTSVPHEDRPSPDRVARFHAVASLAGTSWEPFRLKGEVSKPSLGTRQIVAGTCVGTRSILPRPDVDGFRPRHRRRGGKMQRK